MPINVEEVREAYRIMFRKELRDEQEARSIAEKYDSVIMLCHHLAQNYDYADKFPITGHKYVYTGFEPGDMELLKRHARPSTPEVGFYKDFIGVKTNVRYVKHTASMSNTVEGIPGMDPTFHDGIEWVCMLHAVESARDEFVVMELGAGWGPWMVGSAVAARNAGIPKIRMIAVEGDQGHVGYIPHHARDNGFTEDQYRIVYGAIGNVDGHAFFPIEGDNNWGAEAIFVSDVSELTPERMLPGFGPAFYKQVPAYTLKTAMGNEPKIDVLHVDIQGAEFDVLSNARELLRDRVRWMMIGTHSRVLEGKLMDIFHADGWQMTNEKPCKCHQGHGRWLADLDGSQVWRNPRFATA